MRISALALFAFLVHHGEVNALTTTTVGLPHCGPATSQSRPPSLQLATTMTTRTVPSRPNRFLISSSSKSSSRSDTSLRMAEEYISLEFNDLLGDDGNKAPQQPEQEQPSSSSKSSRKGGKKKSRSSSSKKGQPKKKSLSRGEIQKQRLQSEIDQAESEQVRFQDELKQSQRRSKELEASSRRASNKAQATRQRLQAIEQRELRLQQLSQQLSGGAAGPVVGGIVTIGAAGAAARTFLQQRAVKQEEELERQRQLEQERLEQLAKEEEAMRRRQKANQAVLPLLGATAAIGAVLSGAAGDSINLEKVKDFTTKTAEELKKELAAQQSKLIDQQQKKQQQTSTTAGTTDLENIELPYMDAKIAKVKDQRNVKLFNRRPFKDRKAQVNQQQKDIEDKLEMKIQQAEEQLAKEKVDAEQKAIEEKQLAEERARAAEEQAKVQAEADRVRLAKLEEEAAARKVAEEQKALDDARLAKLEEEAAAQKAAQEQKQAEEAEVARLAAMSKTQSKDKPVPLVSRLLSGNKKPSQIPDKGHSNLFSNALNTVAVGGVALAGISVAAAVIAANENDKIDDEPSTRKTYQVTGKSSEEYLNGSGDQKQPMAPQPRSEPPRATRRIESPPTESGTQRKSASLPSQLDKSNRDGDVVRPASSWKAELREELLAKREALQQQQQELLRRKAQQEEKQQKEQAPPILSQERQSIPKESYSSSGGGGQSTPKKSYSPFGGGGKKPVAPSNDLLYSPPSSTDDSFAGLNEISMAPSQPTMSQDVVETPPVTETTSMPHQSIQAEVSTLAAVDSLSSDAAAAIAAAEAPTFSSSSPSTSSTMPTPFTPSKSFSPFGSKPSASTIDPLASPDNVNGISRDPPAYEMPSISGTSMDTGISYKDTLAETYSPPTVDTTPPDPNSLQSSTQQPNGAAMTALAPTPPSEPVPVKKSFSPFGKKYGPTRTADLSPMSTSEVANVNGGSNFGTQVSNDIPFGASVLESAANKGEEEEMQPEDLYYATPPPGVVPDLEGNSDNVRVGVASEGGDPIPYSSMPATPAVPYAKKSYSPFGSKPTGGRGSGGNGGYLDSM